MWYWEASIAGSDSSSRRAKASEQDTSDAQDRIRAESVPVDISLDIGGRPPYARGQRHDNPRIRETARPVLWQKTDADAIPGLRSRDWCCAPYNTAARGTCRRRSTPAR